jgi:hypothetical protein
MLHSFFEMVFGCSHKRTTFPQTARGGVYVACLDCGQEFAYDWNAMQVGKPVTARTNVQPIAVRDPA